MHRRAILQLATAAIAAGWSGGKARAEATSAAPAFTLDACSRNLQWRRSPQELAKAVADLGLATVDLNIAPYPGHVDPAKARTDLPAFVRALRDSGVGVRTLTTPITGADTPHAEEILAAAAESGATSYTWSGAPYDEAQPYAAQLAALRARFGKLARLNEKHGIKGLYQPQAGAAGSLFVDLLPVMQDFDPKWMAFRYDTAALLQTSSANVVRQLRMGGPYIGAIALNDAAVDLEFPKWRQGHFTDAPEILKHPDGGGDNTGNAGGDWLAYGGGGRPLPYHLQPKPVGVGMIDLTLLGKTLKEIGFSGPAECQVRYELGGAETGSDRITLPPQEVIGRMKRDRIAVEQAFHIPWGLKVALPPFMERQERAAAGSAKGAEAGSSASRDE